VLLKAAVADFAQAAEEHGAGFALGSAVAQTNLCAPTQPIPSFRVFAWCANVLQNHHEWQ